MAKTPACPFCGAPQRDATTPIGGFAGVLLGLALAGCGDDTTEPTTTAAETGQMTDPSATDSSSSSVGETTNSVSDTESAGVSDYGGPSSGFDASTTASDSTTDGTTDTSGGSDSTGTDTGASSVDTGTAEGADYGGAAPRN